jgi:arabinofuranosyltransferase
MRHKISVRSDVWILLLALGILSVGAWHYMPYVADDALISLRYAQRLLDGHGLTWTDGRPVEGYSNLLWILATALLGLFGMDLIVAARILGCACMAAAMIVIYATYRPNNLLKKGYPSPSTSPPPSTLALAVGLLFFSGAGPIAVWAIGGLEQPLCALLLAAAIPAYWAAVQSYSPLPLGEGPGVRAASASPLPLGEGSGVRAAARLCSFQAVAHSAEKCGLLAFLLGLMCWTRPDGPLFAAGFAAAYSLGVFLKLHRWSWRFLLMITLVPAAFYIVQLLFRLMYYGQWVPNTALVKINPSWNRVLDGIDYVGAGLISLVPFSLLAIACLVFGLADRRSRARFLAPAVLFSFWTLYLIFIGGDIFPTHRHFVPVIVVLAYALIEGMAVLGRAAKRLYGISLSRASGWASIPFLFILCLLVQFQCSRCDHWMRNWEWDGKIIGDDLREAFFDRQPLMAVTAAGCIPYWSRLPCIDMLGLNDDYLPRHKPADFSGGLLGHDLGDGPYILGRKPDIILFNIGSEPLFRAGDQLKANEEFRDKYAKVRLRTPLGGWRSTALAWFRLDSPSIGICRGPKRISIPAFFLNAYSHTQAFPSGNRLAVVVGKGRPAGICLSNLRAEDWDVHVYGRNAGNVRSRLRNVRDGVQLDLTAENPELTIVEKVVLIRSVYESRVGRACEAHHEMLKISDNWWASCTRPHMNKLKNETSVRSGME